MLLKLTGISLQNKFRFKKPRVEEEEKGFDDGAEEGDDMEGGADLADMIDGGASDDDIDEDLDFGGQNIQADLARELEAEQQQNAIIQSSISKEKWQLEVEGIAHKLKLGKNFGEGGKEWRTHLEQTRNFAGKVSEKLPELRAMLERLQDDASRALDKISRKEAILSRNFQGMTGDYRAHTEQLREIQSNFTTVSKNVENLETELQEINDRLGSIEKKISDTGKNFSDNTPLHNIKKAIG